ncbi:LysR substrate-binding domain-containing protein [Oceanobacter mangrovi]|uniref:LysR substrate-binding domain-containing protein n=1 Tax=Oceanobacter mangrovi TaxID=2862510 RepID=UPI001C8EFA28|nr:LysR substrate-binding domain-containing protein [Oceanobacter mangrovi]
MSLHNRLPTLPALLAFEAAARHQNFTAAARELGTTQSAVSQQIRGLEEDLRSTLFHRIYRGVQLSEAGQELYKVVRGSLRDIADCVEKLRADEGKKYLNVATDFAFAAFWLLPKLPAFRALHPDVEVRIITSQERHLLCGPDIDVAMLFDRPDNQPGALRLFGEEVFPICSPGFLQQHGPIKSHKGLAALPMLKLRAEGVQDWYQWSSYFRARNSQVEPGEPVLVCDNYTLVIQAAIAGQGLALGWRSLVDEMLRTGLLIALEDFTVSSANGYYAVEPNPDNRSEQRQALLQWLADL